MNLYHTNHLLHVSAQNDFFSFLPFFGRFFSVHCMDKSVKLKNNFRGRFTRSHCFQFSLFGFRSFLYFSESFGSVLSHQRVVWHYPVRGDAVFASLVDFDIEDLSDYNRKSDIFRTDFSRLNGIV